MKRSTLLTIIGAIGVVGTAIMTAKATPKALELLDEAKEEKGEELTLVEKVKTAGPVYIPSAIVGAATVGCVLGANVLNKRSQATLASAYALVDRSYKEYKNRISDDAKTQIKEIIAKDQYDEDEVPNSAEKQLFFDFNTLQYFESTLDEVVQKVTMDDGMECYIISTPIDTTLSYITG